jgi:hypothetical protein
VPEVSQPASQISRDLFDHLLQSDAAGLRVCSRIRSLERAIALGAIPTLLALRYHFTSITL